MFRITGKSELFGFARRDRESDSALLFRCVHELKWDRHHHLEALTYRSIWQRQQFATLVAAAEVITQDTSGSSQIGAGRNRDAAREG